LSKIVDDTKFDIKVKLFIGLDNLMIQNFGNVF